MPSHASPLDLSVVIPARDEARRLPHTLQRLRRWCAGTELRVEVVLADDGSRDDTAGIAARNDGLPLRIVALGRRVGPGAAVRAGMLCARGRRILLCDADGPVPFEEIRMLSEALDAGFDIAAGSRRMAPERLGTPQPLHRIAMGIAWRAAVRLIAPTRISDTQCGFKLFEQKAARAIFSRVRSTGFAFHVEALALAEELGYAVKELPVRWSDVRGSKIRLVHDPLQMLSELLVFAHRRRRDRARAELPPHPVTTARMLQG